MCFLWLGVCSLLPARAAGDPPSSVIAKARFVVVGGKLQADYVTNQTTDDALAGMYGKMDLAQKFKSRVLKEINGSLNALNPIADWKTAVGTSHENVSELIKPDQLAIAQTNSAATLEAWWNQFLADPTDAGEFFEWRPTRTPDVGDESEKSGEPIVESEIKNVLRDSATSLIGKIGASQFDGNNNAVFKIEFSKAEPITAVKIVGMDVPDKWDTAGYRREKERFERELSLAATNLALAWNDDLAVQRMMIILQARGMWNHFTTADKGNPRAVHWLNVTTNNVAEVHLPHLSFIIFESEAGTDGVMLSVARELLSEAERQVVEDSLKIQNESGGDQFLKHIITAQTNEAPVRFIDLFALHSYLVSRRNVPFRPLPVKESWLAPRLDRIRDLGWYVSDTPALKDENQLVKSRGRKRKSELSGGINIVISPPRPKTTTEPAPEPGGTNQKTLKSWLLNTVKYRVETGIKVEDTQPIEWLLRASATHLETFGSLSTELRYRDRFSGTFGWTPGTNNESLLPDNVSAFSDVAPRRKVDGVPIEIERQGFRLSKQISLPLGDWDSALSAGLELAHVRDIDNFVPNGDELNVPLSYSIFSESDPWDARAYWNLRLSATPAVRWQSNDTDFWVLAGAAGQVRCPRGPWDYFGSFDAQWAAGSTPADALPYVGGISGVRGVRPYGVPARARIVLRNEIWWQIPFVGRDIGSDQHWYRMAYQSFRVAGFVDAAWASEIRERTSTRPWFVAPGVGLRMLVAKATHLDADYAYGICRPSELGGHRFTFGITTQF